MKQNSATLIFLFMVLTTMVKAQIPARTVITPPIVQHGPRPKLEILQVVLSQDSLRPAGNAQIGYYKATISSSGSGWVYYEWVLTGNHVPNAPPPRIIKDSILLNGSGTDAVYHHVSVLPNSPTALKMQTTSPNYVSSNTATY